MRAAVLFYFRLILRFQNLILKAIAMFELNVVCNDTVSETTWYYQIIGNLICDVLTYQKRLK